MSTNSQVIPYTLIDYNGQKARKYPDGSIRNSRGQLLVRHPQAKPITSDNAIAYQRKCQELRAATIAQVAAEAVENNSLSVQYGDMNWVAAIAQAQYIKATTPDDPKSTAAANFLLEQAGLSAKQAASGDNQASDSSIRSVLSDIACIAKAMTIDNVDAKCSYLKHGSVVDGSVVDDDDVKKDSEDKSGGGG